MPLYTKQLYKLLVDKSSDEPNASASLLQKEDYSLRLLEVYTELLVHDPSFCVKKKIELEMWDKIFRSPISFLQQQDLNKHYNGPFHSLVHIKLQRKPTVDTSLARRNALEFKLRLTTLLDRASGCYFTLIQRLLQTLDDSSWPKLLINNFADNSTLFGLCCNLPELGQSIGRFDLDLATFAAFDKSDFDCQHNIWFSGQCNGDYQSAWKRRFNHHQQPSADPGSEIRVKHRILARGDRLDDDDSKSITHGDRASVKDMNPSKTEVITKCLEVEHHTADADDVNQSQLGREDAVSYVLQYCLIHIGDVARYSRESNTAASYYIWAWLVNPSSGHPFNQLALLEAGKQDKRIDALFYYYVRAMASRHSFPLASINLSSLLKHTNLTALSSKSAIENVTNSLLCLLAVYQIKSVHLVVHYVRLQSSLSDFFRSVDEKSLEVAPGDHLCLLRLTTIHLYQLSQFFPPTGLSSTANHYEFLLLFETLVVNWVDFLITVVDNVSPGKGKENNLHRHAPFSSRVHQSALTCLLLSLLWLLQLTNDDCHLLNSYIKSYCPAFGQRLVDWLNQVTATTNDCLVVELTCKASSVHDGEGATASTNKDDPPSSQHEVSIACHTLINLIPDVGLLQGFLPLRLPIKPELHKQGRLTSSLHSFNHASLTAFASSPDNANDCAELKEQLSTFVHQLAWAVAHRYPLLLNWSASPSDKINTVDQKQSDEIVAYTPTGQFQRPARPDDLPSIRRLMDKSSSMWSTKEVSLPVDCSSSSSEVDDDALKTISEFSAKYSDDATLAASVESTDPRQSSGQVPSFPFTFMPPPDWLCQTPVVMTTDDVGNHIPSSSSTSSVNNDVNQSVVTATTVAEPLATKSNDRVSTVSNSQPLTRSTTASETGNSFKKQSVSSNSSGGLIVNAELAKFIQEQATQVAARQQRSGGLVVDGTNNNNATTSSGKQQHGTSSSSSSNAFKRNLPPRFARLLLQQQQAASDQQQNVVGTTTSDSSSYPSRPTNELSTHSVRSSASLSPSQHASLFANVNQPSNTAGQGSLHSTPPFPSSSITKPNQHQLGLLGQRPLAHPSSLSWLPQAMSGGGSGSSNALPAIDQFGNQQYHNYHDQVDSLLEANRRRLQSILLPPTSVATQQQSTYSPPNLYHRHHFSSPSLDRMMAAGPSATSHHHLPLPSQLSTTKSFNFGHPQDLLQQHHSASNSLLLPPPPAVAKSNGFSVKHDAVFNNNDVSSSSNGSYWPDMNFNVDSDQQLYDR